MPEQPDLRVNRLLALLPPADLDRISRSISVVVSPHHEVIYAAGLEPQSAYFPLGSVMSVIATDKEGRGVEAASVGREGMVGLTGALGGGGMIGEVITQVAGWTARLPMDAVRAEVERPSALAHVLDRYTVALLSQISQGLVCNRHHPVDSRAARWLLATHDRVGEDSFVLTQDFLSIMLGVTRPQVSLAAASLRRAGLIDYRRGRIRVIDRRGLEAAVCECYGIIQAEFARLLRNDGQNGWPAVGG
jgi:CRP-like cAMP-binding protein